MANDELLKALADRFDTKLEMTKPRPGGGQGGLTYVPGEVVIERLNSVLGPGGWGWRVTHHEIGQMAVVIHGELDALGHTYSGCDAHPLHIRDGASAQQTADALANALKSADTGALVRAARLLGVGLYLWRGGAPQEADLDDEPATKRQLDGIVAQSKVIGLSKAELGQRAGKPANQLTRREARELSERLNAEAVDVGRATKIRQRAAAVASRLGWEPAQLVAALGGVDIVKATTADVIKLEPMIADLEAKAPADE